MKRVTVLTTTYRKFDNIENNIKSVYMQDYCNIQYIISDDGSDEFDEEYIRSLLPTNRPDIEVVIIHHAKNVGTVKNLNHAISIGNGDIFIPLSQDDSFAASNAISTIVHYFEMTSVELVTYKRAGVNEQGIVVATYPKAEKAKLLRTGEQNEILEEECSSAFISGSSTSYSKSILEKYDGFDEKYLLIEDMPFYIRAMRDGVTMGFIDEIIINYGMQGSTGHGVKPSIKIVNDRRRCYSELIFPISKSFSRSNQKRLLYRYTKEACVYNRCEYYVNMIKCADILINKAFNKIRRKVCK